MSIVNKFIRSLRAFEGRANRVKGAVKGVKGAKGTEGAIVKREESY